MDTTNIITIAISVLGSIGWLYNRTREANVRINGIKDDFRDKLEEQDDKLNAFKLECTKEYSTTREFERVLSKLERIENLLINKNSNNQK